MRECRAKLASALHFPLLYTTHLAWELSFLLPGSLQYFKTTGNEGEERKPLSKNSTEDVL
jgi:hypothetical protein